MNIAKHIFTLVMGASICTMAQTEQVPDSLAAVPDSASVQPVAENVEAAPVENAPADSAVVDSTVQSAEVAPEAAPEAVADTSANPVAIDALWADESVKSAQTETAVAPDTAKPVVDSVAPVAPVDTAAVSTAEVMDLGWEAKPVATVDSAKVAPESPLSKILHGNAYNPVANEAAAATVGGEMSIPHRMFSRRFAYFEPVDQEGVVSFGQSMTYFFAFDNNNDLALVTAGIAKERFGLMLQGAVGKKWSYVDDDDAGTEETIKGTSAGTAIGGTISARFSGLDLALRVAYDQPEGESAVYGGDVETETDIWNMGGKFLISRPGTISWSAGLSFYRYNSKNKIVEKSVFEQGGKYYLATSTAHMTDSTARVEVIPEFNVGGAILTHEKARVFMGLNMMAPMATYDRIKNVCSRHNEYALMATPNILGEVMLGSHVVAFGSASHQWDVFRYRDSYINEVSTKSMDISSGVTTANLGMRLEYEMAAVEVAFTRQFLSNPFGAFSTTDDVMTSIGMFINF